MPSAADLIRDARERHGLSQAALARRARTTSRQIRRIENGEISPSARTLERLLHVLGERLELQAVPIPIDERALTEVRADLADLAATRGAAQDARR